LTGEALVNDAFRVSLFRHGDVLLLRAVTLPADASPVPGHVLVRGEVSGHAHCLEDPNAGALFHSAAGFFLEVSRPTRIIHEEHAPISLEPGVYRYWQQREYSPREIRTVVD
jgi:hypothetical protein